MARLEKVKISQMRNHNRIECARIISQGKRSRKMVMEDQWAFCYSINPVSRSSSNVAMILNLTKLSVFLCYNQRSVVGADIGHDHFNSLLQMW